MSVIYIVLPIAVLLAVIAVGAFIWSARSGQLDDLDAPAMRVAHEDDDASTTGRASVESSAP